MSEVEVRERNDLAIRATGEVVDLNDPVAAALALEQVREVENELGAIKRELTRAIVAHAQVSGETRLELGGRRQAEIRSGEKTTYDATRLEEMLREAGMPEERIREIVKEEVSYTVVAKELKKAAKLNPDYAEAMEAVRSTFDSGPTVSIRRR